MTLTNIEISIVSQCALGLASIIGLLYKQIIINKSGKQDINYNDMK